MAATTLDRNTQKKGPIRQVVLPLAAAATGAAQIPIGVMAMVLNPSTGALNAAATATGIVMGLSCQRANFADGDREIVVERGIFKLANDGSITAANIGQLCLVIDNQTVGMVQAQNIGAGYITEVESDGVWVDMTQAKIAAA